MSLTSKIFSVVVLLFAAIISNSCGNFCINCKEQTLILAGNDSSYGYIDLKGNIKIPYQYVEAYQFSEGMALVSLGKDLYGFINKDGEYVIFPKYKKATSFKEGIAFVMDERNRIFAINKSGKLMYELEGIDRINSFSEGRATITRGIKSGVIDMEGVIIVPFIYNMIYPFKDGYALVSKFIGDGLMYNFIDVNGNVLSDRWFQRANSFNEGYAKVSFNGKEYGMIDTTGKVILEPIYSDLLDYSNGLIGVRFGDRYGYISIDGDIIINPMYERVSNIKMGRAVAVLPDGEEVIVDAKGKILETVGEHDNYGHTDHEEYKKRFEKYSNLFSGNAWQFEPVFYLLASNQVEISGLDFAINDCSYDTLFGRPASEMCYKQEGDLIVTDEGLVFRDIRRNVMEFNFLHYYLGQRKKEEKEGARVDKETNKRIEENGCGYNSFIWDLGMDSCDNIYLYKIGYLLAKIMISNFVERVEIEKVKKYNILEDMCSDADYLINGYLMQYEGNKYGINCVQDGFLGRPIIEVVITEL